MFEANSEGPQPDCAIGPAGRQRNAATAPKPILIVLHQEQSTPGHVGRTLIAQGHRLDVRKPRFGDPLPETLAGHAGAVIFGGPMSANDDDDYIRREIEWIAVALRENVPFLGICLGAQMLARQLGARVFLDPDAQVEIGYHDIIPEPASPGGLAWPDRVYQWHKEGFDLPAGARCLASSHSPFACQAFAYGSALAVQFHPEITYAQVHRWSGKNPEKLLQAGAQDRPGQLRDHIALAPGIHRWLDALLHRWKAQNVS